MGDGAGCIGGMGPWRLARSWGAVCCLRHMCGGQYGVPQG